MNNQANEDILFCVSVKSLDNNTSKKPKLITETMEKNKIIKSFKIEIPNYNSKEFLNDIPRLNCIYEIMINENFIIFIIIDALIKLNISKLLVYDFLTKQYVENEVTIYLNDKIKDTLAKKKRNIKLKFVLFSTIENKKFNLTINEFKGIKLLPEKMENVIKNGMCIFNCELVISYFLKNNMISYLRVDLNDYTLELKINFMLNPTINEENIKIYERLV